LSGAVATAAAHVPSLAHVVVAVMSSASLDLTTGHGRDRGAAGEIAVKWEPRPPNLPGSRSRAQTSRRIWLCLRRPRMRRP
jgi:hypothetical protein